MQTTSGSIQDDALPVPCTPHRIELAVVVPTYNERGNIAEFISRLEQVLKELTWELIFVDDDSPDETAGLITEYARRDRRIRLIHRIGRRGLSSACIEGILATSATSIAVMDADMQHDETILPRMLEMLRRGSLDLVVGTRNAEGGSMGDFTRNRQTLSRWGLKVSHAVCQCRISDPMSGFFVVSRSFFFEVAHHLHGGGFKILVDMLSSATRPVRFAEVGYTFRLRQHGESKLDVNTAVEYLFLVIDKLSGRIIPVRFAAFALVGATGAATHLLCLALLMFVFHVRFLPAQIIATYIAMTENFFLNNLITWRDRSLRGFRLVSGLASFWLACSFGAWANVLFARALLQAGLAWWAAGIAGIVLSSVWNYSIANLFTWQKQRPRGSHRAKDAQAVESSHAYHSDAPR
ncbi:MAG TPA: glycosyltransferase family 2 protein [Acidobacteriaceae bacterium]